MTDFCPPLNPDIPLHVLAPELVDVFEDASFNTHDSAAHLGPQATEALYRGEPAAVEVATGNGSQMDLLIRLFLLHEPMPATELAKDVGPVLATKLVDANVAQTNASGVVRIALDIRSHVIDGANRWVFSDVDDSVVDHIPISEHVICIGAESNKLF